MKSIVAVMRGIVSAGGEGLHQAPCSPPNHATVALEAPMLRDGSADAIRCAWSLVPRGQQLRRSKEYGGGGDVCRLLVGVA